MKKTVSLIMSVCLTVMTIFSLTACGGETAKTVPNVTENDHSVADTSTTEDKSDNETPMAQTPDNVDWKQFLKEYEEWVDSYIVLLKKYKDNPSDTSILSDYMEQMQKISE